MRPTSERLREAVLATLGRRVEGARFLDLYAGAGAVGLESLSRGATEAIFVESHRPAGKLIQGNARLCGFEDRVRILVMTVERGLARLRREGVIFDVVFIDPPYDRGEAAAAMVRLGQWLGLVAPRGVVVCQHSRHEELGEEIGGLSRMRRKRFGETIIDSYEPREQARHSAGGSGRTSS